MPRILTDDAIVLRTYNVGEADTFCILLLREHGKVAARAMGSRKILSRKRGLLPCHRITVTVSSRSSGHTIQSVRCLDSASHAWMEAPAFASASSALELVLRMTEEGVAMPEVYDLCREFLEEMAGQGNNASLVRERDKPVFVGQEYSCPTNTPHVFIHTGSVLLPLFTLKLLGLLGLLPSLHRSCISARDLPMPAVFSERLGGLCFPEEEQGFTLSKETCMLLRNLEREPFSVLLPLSASVTRDLEVMIQGLLGNQLGISLSSPAVSRSISSALTPTCHVNGRAS